MKEYLQNQESAAVAECRAIYNLPGWSGGYFDISADGHALAISPRHPDHPGIDLHALTKQLGADGLSPPVLVRFKHILEDRLDQLVEAFDKAVADYSYGGRYTAIYPIKVNQQRTVVETLLNHGGERVGLEAGSKPELMAVISLSRPGGLVICNGYKDREYIRLALFAQLLGLHAVIVIEKLSELDVVLREAKALNMRPKFGLRVRLASVGSSKWQNTGGDRAKFGLSAGQVQQLVARVAEENLLDCLELLHFHMGSQITRLSDIEHGLREARAYFLELRRLGASVKIVDAGGGLGIDYEGTRSQAFCSMNYSLDEYAHAFVRSFAEVCETHGLTPPDMLTEAGRSMTAHHAALIVNVIDVEHVSHERPAPQTTPNALLADLNALWEKADFRDPAEIYHEAEREIRELQARFSRGELSLACRSHAEQLFSALTQKLLDKAETSDRPDTEFANRLRERLADKYFCNFSVFQSIPDVWAFDQIFPIIPLHRLNELPTRRAILQDLTCDSDGQIRTYVDKGGVEPSLPLHAMKKGEEYLLGIFLVGAYQEILGDMHNLFGDTHAVDVVLGPNGSFEVQSPEPGDRIDEILSLVHFDPEALMAAVHDKILKADLPESLRKLVEQELVDGLAGYTYLED